MHVCVCCLPETVFRGSQKERWDQSEHVRQCHTAPPTIAGHPLHTPDSSSYPKQSQIKIKKLFTTTVQNQLNFFQSNCLCNRRITGEDTGGQAPSGFQMFAATCSHLA